MPDPIDELGRFGAGLDNGAQGGDMALSAAAARRRGDQIRRRRTAWGAAGAALAVAAVAVPVFAVVGGDTDNDPDQVTKDPTTSHSLGVADLLTAPETEYEVGVPTPWTDVDTYEGDGQAAMHVCQRDKLSDLGAQTSFTRFFDWDATEPTPGTGLSETIAEFKDADAASAAYDEVTDWLETCEGRLPGDDFSSVHGPRNVDAAGGDKSGIYDISWGPAPEELDPTGDSGYINETGLVLLDDRIALLSLTIIGMDYNWLDEDGGTPVFRMLTTATAKLAPDADGSDSTDSSSDDPATSPADTASSSAVDPTIPDDFPLAVGWPDSSEAEPGMGLEGPAADLDPTGFTACDTTLDDAPHADRLVARWQNVEDSRSRMLTTYATAEEATAVVDEIAELYRSCPVGDTRDDGFTPNWAVRDLDLGGQSIAVLGWDELDGAATTFGDTIIVVRVGNAVLVVAQGGHSGNPQGREDEIVDDLSQESAPVIDEMCRFTGAGC